MCFRVVTVDMECVIVGDDGGGDWVVLSSVVSQYAMVSMWMAVSVLLVQSMVGLNVQNHGCPKISQSRPRLAM